MSSVPLHMERRMLRAALLGQRGATLLAVLAVAIGASVASAMLHVTGDISRRLAHELKSLGPNLLVVPPVGAGGDPTAAPGAATATRTFLDQSRADAALARTGVRAVPLLYAVARVGGDPVVLVGTDLAAARALHPNWRVGAGGGGFVGRRLMARLEMKPGDARELVLPNGSRVTVTAGAPLEAGGADDEAWWLPLADVQRWAGLDGRVSLYQARIEGGAEDVGRLRRQLERDGDVRLLPIGSLTAAEAQLLGRMRRLMLLVTLAALLSAGLCALGTLTDRVLEQRRDFALMKALGAGRREILKQFAAEALAIGLVGGLVGWLLGLGMAQVIGREVFHTAIAVRWDVPPLVVAMALAVAALSSLGPARMALAVEPADALKGD